MVLPFQPDQLFDFSTQVQSEHLDCYNLDKVGCLKSILDTPKYWPNEAHSTGLH